MKFTTASFIMFCRCILIIMSTPDENKRQLVSAEPIKPRPDCIVPEDDKMDTSNTESITFD